jgi:hypothetical protein
VRERTRATRREYANLFPCADTFRRRIDATQAAPLGRMAWLGVRRAEEVRRRTTLAASAASSLGMAYRASQSAGHPAQPADRERQPELRPSRQPQTANRFTFHYDRQLKDASSQNRSCSSLPPRLLRLFPAGAVAGWACTHWKRRVVTGDTQFERWDLGASNFRASARNSKLLIHFQVIILHTIS